MDSDKPKEIFAFYNVENLLLPDPRPVHSADPTASGLRNWDIRKYRQKLNKIAHVAELILTDEGVLPALFGIAEIQGAKPLCDLLEYSVFQNYDVVHYPSADSRAIDVALFYDRRKIDIISSKPLRLSSDAGENFETRDILHVRFTFCAKIMNAYVLHFPSKKDKDANFRLRKSIIAILHTELSQNSGEEAIILMGDFNANPDDILLKPFFGTDFGKGVFNPFLDLYLKNIYSTYHHKNGLLFDQMMLSDHFFHSDFPLKFKVAKVFSHLKLRNPHRKFGHRPARTFAGTRYLGGYSDHFPIITEFI